MWGPLDVCGSKGKGLWLMLPGEGQNVQTRFSSGPVQWVGEGGVFLAWELGGSDNFVCSLVESSG